MSKKIIVVTGASSGIGLAIAELLAASGFAVLGVSRRPPAVPVPAFTHIPVDLSDAEALERVIGGTGQIYGLVHAAGMLRVGRADAFDHAEGAAMWRLHVDAAARLIGGLGAKIEPGGRIVLVGSRVARGAAGRALYAASKAALSGLARSVAAEFAPTGITVNIVAPGATDTPMLRDPARVSEPPRMPPIGRLIQPSEVAGTVAFLFSPFARSITGQEIVICGGASL